MASPTKENALLQRLEPARQMYSAHELRWRSAWRTATEAQSVTGRVLPDNFGRAREVEFLATAVFLKTSKNQDIVDDSRESGRGCRLNKPSDF